MNRSLTQLILIHIREFFREPGILFWAIGFPVLMAWGLGIAFSGKHITVKHISYNENISTDNTFMQYLKEAKEIKHKDSEYYEKQKSVNVKNLGTTDFHFIKSTQKEAEHLLKSGKAVIYIDEKDGNIRYNFDPANSDAKLTYLLLSAAVNNTEINETDAKVIPLTIIGTRYIDFLIPGLIAMGIISSLMWGVSYGLIDKRNKKLLRRMVATPMSKIEFLISHFIARFFLSFVESAVLFIFAWLYFDIKIYGSIPSLILLILAGNIAFYGIAITVSSRTSNTEIGNGLINAVIMPMMVLSGIFFSYHNFPDIVIPFIKILPLTMLADGIREIFIEGSGFYDVIPEIATLTLTGIGFFFIGIRIYKWY